MKKTIIYVFFTFFVFSHLTIYAAQVKVENVMGRAEYRKLSDTKWKKLKLNQELSENHRIRVGKKSWVLLIFDDGSKITLRNLVIFDVKKITRTSKQKVSSFKVFWGKVKVVAKKLKRKEDIFEIHTPTAVIGVRGTIFGVSVRGEEQSEVAVFSGEVEVKSTKKIKEKPVIVKSLQKTVIKKDKPPEKPTLIKQKTFDEWATKLEKEEKYIKEDFIKW